MTRHPQAKYRKIVGGLMNARGIVQALAKGDIDVGPLDGYVWDLICAGDPDFAAQVRVIASTDPTPMPPLIATAALKPEEIARLRSAFRNAHNERSLDEARQALLVERFVVPDMRVYQETRNRADRVEWEGEPWP
jgi:ABC-type phosphate/phosphonate transport system substrate-binding protein